MSELYTAKAEVVKATEKSSSQSKEDTVMGSTPIGDEGHSNTELTE